MVKHIVIICDVNRDLQPSTSSETSDKCRDAQESQSADHMDKCAHSNEITEKDKNKSQAFVTDNSLLKYYLQGNFGGPVSVIKKPLIPNEGLGGELRKSPRPCTSMEGKTHPAPVMPKSASGNEADKDSRPSTSKGTGKVLSNSKHLTSKENSVWNVYENPRPSTSKEAYVHPQPSQSKVDSDWDTYKSQHLSKCYVPYDMSKGPTPSTSKADPDWSLYTDPYPSTSKETYDVFKDPIPSTSKENPGWDRYFSPRPSTSKDVYDNPRPSTSKGVGDHDMYTNPRPSTSRHQHGSFKNPAPSTSMYIPDYKVNKNPSTSPQKQQNVYLNPTPSTSKCNPDEPRPSTSKDTYCYSSEYEEDLNGNEYIPNYDDPLDISKHIPNYTGEHGLNLSMKTSTIFDILGIVPITSTADSKVATKNATEGSYMNEFQKFITVGTDLSVNRKAKKHRPSKKQTDEKKD